ncbi:protein-lysine N-methyltransferase EEF2KMT [Pectinophora gossypiella]|uniref:protein-lysine N-methyltransferase EEF2KMT n=1 Tax=Pectinophora gossypiella TaxID=13191 RepID=UPI00214F13A3|nr:protein-lysine N-methyltransferase EEF2KMT [Pectinophora gossypiella]
MDEKSDLLLEKIIKAFFNRSLTFSLQPEEIELFTWDKQQAFLNATIQNKAVVKHPVSSEFCRLFFKKVIDFLEPVQEVHDDFYTHLCSVLKNSSVEDYCFRHYMIGDDYENLIIMKETKNMVVNGTTGMRTWQAALMLADWIISNKNQFSGKNILELGSGVGFTGITIAKTCRIPSLYLTDCHEDVLKAICDNIEINFPQMGRKENGDFTIYSDEHRNIGVMMLDWNSLDDYPYKVVPDVIIGADIIYDPIILKPLCNVIKTFFSKNKYLEVYIANIIRNEDTYKSFIEMLDFMGLTCEQQNQSKGVCIHWDNTIQRCLLKIKLK